jgi:hypothetical protein
VSNATQHSQKHVVHKGQTSIESALAPKPKRTQDDVDASLLNFVVSTGVSFNAVTMDAFKELFDLLVGPQAPADKKKIRVPSRRTLTARLADLYKATRLRVAAEILDTNAIIAFVGDCWASKAFFAFLALNYQLIDRHGVLKTGLVAMKYIPKDEAGHTGEFLRDAIVACVGELVLLKLIDDAEKDQNDDDGARLGDLRRDGVRHVDVRSMTSDLLGRCVGIVTDGGGNIAKATRLLTMQFNVGGSIGTKRARRCMCHLLQLVLKYFCLHDKDLADALAGKFVQYT